MAASPEEGPLWDSIKRQLYKPEVSLVKRLVGDQLIQQNRLMWAEISSLRQMLSEYQERNDKLCQGKKQQVNFCDTQHRDLLKKQAQIILEDLNTQAHSLGHVLEDLVPELRSTELREFVLGDASIGLSKSKSSDLLGPSPPATPSTRPSTASGYSISCSTPDLFKSMASMTSLPMGSPLGAEDIDAVAEGIREALEAEQASLLAAIGEEMQRLEAEDARRVDMESRAARGEPSTASLQQFLHRLQDISISPHLRSLALTAGVPQGEPQAVQGGASVRRLQALISQRRNLAANQTKALGPVLEAPAEVQPVEPWSLSSVTPSGYARGFDPFFDDPFAC
eukprot:TRINITY_DN30937_c0_g1_i1.p1 TRINITY_DN30937_c0_g1~~TRINITY_DN30937_c0_g1_i1.p1  ORF type:complete len:338 (-),score=65.03 TRINITY_DN30937_c0_g1_i1:210-1223(-)